jgi:hypothetical protein
MIDEKLLDSARAAIARRSVRAAKGSHEAIADRFGISRRHVGGIKERSVWKHLI